MKETPKTVCVYCSSSDAVAPVFHDAATELGRLIGERGWALVWGGVRLGLMGAVARAAQAAGARVIGIIPHAIDAMDIAYERADEKIVTRDLRERKAVMEERSDAFIALPGGIGTIEETMEVLTLKQLRQHTKPVIFLNTGSHWDPVLTFLEHLIAARFARPEFRNLYEAAATPAGALDLIENYRPPESVRKWF
ncbi:TIGR00730 family Rossman fold protein [Candidatus Poribacteria bacterium]|nr:TIGR00730 family Rossman fold protein [Candidatus Poribacteria bacterium]